MMLAVVLGRGTCPSSFVSCCVFMFNMHDHFEINVFF